MDVVGVELTGICTRLQESIDRRETIHKHLKEREERLEAELKVVKEEMKDNSNCLKKCGKVMEDCLRLNQLSLTNKTDLFANLNYFSDARQETLEETKQSEMLLNRIITKDKDKKPPAKKNSRPTKQSHVNGHQILFTISSHTDGILATADITDFLHSAVKEELIVSHESRCLTMDLGIHGRFLIQTRMESNVPRVLSAMPLPSVNPNSDSSNPGSLKKGLTQPIDLLQSNIYTPDVLRSVFGPDAGEGKISTINRSSSNPLPVLIMPNGEMRRLTESQVDQIKQYLLDYQQYLLSLLSALSK